MDNKTQLQQNATNPSGQKHTMAGTAGMQSPPNADMHPATKEQAIDPTSSKGCSQFEK